MNGKKLIVNLFILIAAITVLFVGYRLFFQSTAPAPELVGLEPAGFANSDVASAGASDEFLVLLLSLQSIDLSGMPKVAALLSGLEDFSTELAPQTPGRSNPFAPIGRGGRPATATSTATTTRPR